MRSKRQPPFQLNTTCTSACHFRPLYLASLTAYRDGVGYSRWLPCFLSDASRDPLSATRLIDHEHSVQPRRLERHGCLGRKISSPRPWATSQFHCFAAAGRSLQPLYIGPPKRYSTHTVSCPTATQLLMVLSNLWLHRCSLDLSVN